jgi:hypothetical protein
VQRELELTGDADLVAIFNEVFAALSGGRHVPTVATSTESEAYFGETTKYLTPQGDGLTVWQCLDYGGCHTRRFPSLVVGDITVTNVREQRKEILLRLTASEERIDEATETVKRIAIANGLTFVKEHNAT